MNKKTKIGIGIGVGVLAVVGALLYFLRKDKNGNGSGTDDQRSGAASGGLSLNLGTDTDDDGEVDAVVQKLVWAFYDNYWTGGGGDFGDEGQVGYSGYTKPPFSVGDTVYITQAAGAKYPEYDGQTKIEAIVQADLNGQSVWVVDTTQKRLGDTPVNSGIITNYPMD